MDSMITIQNMPTYGYTSSNKEKLVATPLGNHEVLIRMSGGSENRPEGV